MRNRIDVVVLIYALLSLGMGLEAYIAKKSLPSLLGGGGAGIILIGLLALGKTNPRAGRIGSAIVTLLLLGRFSPTFLTQWTWYPAGIMAIASAIVFAVLAGGHMAAMKKKKAGLPEN